MWGVTIRQPYAALIAAGAKWTETRSRRPPDARVGERIFIHAGKARPTDGVTLGDAWRVFRAQVQGDVDIVQHHAEGLEGAPTSPLVLHYGAIVATAVIADVAPLLNRPRGPGIERTSDGRLIRWQTGPSTSQYDMVDITSQLPLGNWHTPNMGRVQTWAWFLADIQPLTQPIPASGKQGWWQHPMDDGGEAIEPDAADRRRMWGET